MSYTLAQAILDLARLICDVWEGTATGGSDTTLVDSNVIEGDDFFNQGTLWLLTCANAGKTAIITDWVSSTHTWTFATLGLLNASGDVYAATTSDIPRRILRQAVNRALFSIGSVPTTYEDATFITVADQEEYTLPTGVKDVLQVWIANITTSPYDYYEHFGWIELDGKIRFDTYRKPAEAGYRIRLIYKPAFSWLTTDAGAISDYIHRDRLAWKAAVHALRWRVGRVGTDELKTVDMLNEALRNELVYDSLYPLPNIQRSPHLAGFEDQPV